MEKATKKRILPVLLVLALVFSILTMTPISAYAGDSPTIRDNPTIQAYNSNYWAYSEDNVTVQAGDWISGGTIINKGDEQNIEVYVNGQTPPTLLHKDESCTLKDTLIVEGHTTESISLRSPKTCGVSFETNGGSPLPDVQEVEELGKATEPTPAPQKDGYVFTGWFTEPGCVNLFDFGNTQVTDSMTLYAGWEINEYTVQFDAQGGSPQPESQLIQYNSKATKPTTDPKKDDYVFTGWFADQNLETLFDFENTPITQGITLYAGWKEIPEYKLTAGDAQTWTKGTSTGASFTSNAPFELFAGVRIDDTLIDSSNYTVSEGSTIVVLKPSYLETLKAGEHKIVIEAKDGGSVSGTFKVAAAKTPDDKNSKDKNSTAKKNSSPPTGDSAPTAIYITLLCAAFAGIIIAFKKRRMV